MFEIIVCNHSYTISIEINICRPIKNIKKITFVNK